MVKDGEISLHFKMSDSLIGDPRVANCLWPKMVKYPPIVKYLMGNSREIVVSKLF